MEVNNTNAQDVVNNLTMSVELADEDDQTAINFDVITEVIVNISAIVALAQVGGTAAIPLQQQVNVCTFISLVLFTGLPCFYVCFLLLLLLLLLFFDANCTPSGKKTVT